MGPPSLDLAGVLVDAGIGTFGSSSAWAIFVSTEPDRPSQAITLYDTGGFPPDPQVSIDHPTVQVRVRGSKDGYAEGYAKVLACRDALHLFRGTVDSTTRYIGVWAMQDPVWIGKDDSARPLFTCNFRCLRTQIGAPYPRAA